MPFEVPLPADVDPLDPPAVVARGLNVSTQTLANWRSTQRNPLPYVKLGRMVRYKRSVWTRFAETGSM
jgi:hypothetical protein